MQQPSIRRRRRIGVVIPLVFGAGIIACHGDATSPDQCSTATVVAVTAGTVPTFSWTGGCRVTYVVVQQLTPSFQSVWSVFSTVNFDNAYASPIVYGQTPAPGGSVQDGPIPLVAGRQYKASFLSHGKPGEDDRVIEVTFVP